MSTGTPIPSAPEMPTSSSLSPTSTLWDYDNKDDSTDDTDTTSRTLNSTDNDTTTQSSILTKATSSDTSYAFTGSALGTGSIETVSGDQLNADSAKDKDSIDSKNEMDSKDEDKNDDSMYECNICLDIAKDAVVSLCGHLFCWPCLHQWLETRPNRKLCPVCKAAISKEKVIPLYGRNSSKQEDPRNKVPPRPAGQRTEPEPQQGFPGFGFGDGFYMSFGIGSFPFAYFTSSFNLWENRPAAANRGTPQYEDEQQLSKLFLYLAFLCIAWLLFA